MEVYLLSKENAIDNIFICNKQLLFRDCLPPGPALLNPAKQKYKSIGNPRTIKHMFLTPLMILKWWNIWSSNYLTEMYIHNVTRISWKWHVHSSSNTNFKWRTAPGWKQKLTEACNVASLSVLLLVLLTLQVYH